MWCCWRRLSPGWLTSRVVGGEIHTFGPDPYRREDLGKSLYLLFYTTDELRSLSSDQVLGADPTFVLRREP